MLPGKDKIYRDQEEILSGEHLIKIWVDLTYGKDDRNDQTKPRRSGEVFQASAFWGFLAFFFGAEGFSGSSSIVLT